jgi:hypothetical protein
MACCAELQARRPTWVSQGFRCPSPARRDLAAARVSLAAKARPGAEKTLRGPGPRGVRVGSQIGPNLGQIRPKFGPTWEILKSHALPGPVVLQWSTSACVTVSWHWLFPSPLTPGLLDSIVRQRDDRGLALCLPSSTWLEPAQRPRRFHHPLRGSASPNSYRKPFYRHNQQQMHV